MGTPIDPIATGEACPICWGSDKTFGYGPPPATVVLTIEGVTKTILWSPGDGEAFEGNFVLDQIDSNPCIYESFPDGGNMIMAWGPSESVIFIRNSDFKIVFFQTIADRCKTEFNDNDPDPEFADGSVKITIMRPT